MLLNVVPRARRVSRDGRPHYLLARSCAPEFGAKANGRLDVASTAHIPYPHRPRLLCQQGPGRKVAVAGVVEVTAFALDGLLQRHPSIQDQIEVVAVEGNERAAVWVRDLEEAFGEAADADEQPERVAPLSLDLRREYM